MGNQTTSKLWWIDVLEHVGQLPSQPQKAGFNFVLDNPVYARSLARAYLAGLSPAKHVENFVGCGKDEAA